MKNKLISMTICHKILTIFLCMIQFSAFGQRIGAEEIDDLQVSPWNAETLSDYQYVYHFGESEGESSFIVLIALNKCYAQIISSYWNEVSKTWFPDYENLTNVKIEGNKFSSDQKNGEFVIYDSGQEKSFGLKIYDSGNGMKENNSYEIGLKTVPVTDYFPGKYPQASIRILNKEELTKMTKPNLKIMRNEVFARYGFKFKAGGEMDLYFKKQDWYSARHDNIDNFLTELEKENIKLIKQMENE